MTNSPAVLLRKIVLLLEALWLLLKSDLAAQSDFSRLRRHLNVEVAAKNPPAVEGTIVSVAAAVNRACRYYPKTPKCLQRSLALASMLRKRGIAADLQIGVRQSPFESHAWVEVAGRVINDRPQVREVYETLHEFKAMSCAPRGE